MSILKPKEPRNPTPLPQLRRNKRAAVPPWLIVFVGVIAALGMATAIAQIVSPAEGSASLPLGPTLPSYRGTPIAGGLAPLVIGGTPAAGAAVVPASPPPPPPGTPLCGGPRELFLLLVGLDNETNYDNTLADSIRLVRFDFVEPSVSLLAIQRDSFVVIPDLPSNASKNLFGFMGEVVDDRGHAIFPPSDYGKINIAYFYGNLYDLPGGGATLLAKTIYLNFGVESDNYLVMNMSAFRDVVDAMGGLDIDVPRNLSDPDKGWFFEAGFQHMDGEQALRYARIRHPDTDWQRTERQTQILLAVRDKMLLPQNWSAVPGIVNQFIGNIRTDLSRDEIAGLLCLASQTPRENIRSYQFNEAMTRSTKTNTGVFVMLIDPVAAGNEVYRFLYGKSP